MGKSDQVARLSVMKGFEVRVWTRHGGHESSGRESMRGRLDLVSSNLLKNVGQPADHAGTAARGFR